MITLDGIRFSGDMSGQRKLAEHRKKYYTRVVTGYQDKRTKKYGGPPKAGGRGWYYETTQTPTYGYIRKTPYVPPKAAAKPKATPKKVSTPKPSYKPKPVTKAGKVTKAAAPKYNIAKDPAYKALQKRLKGLTTDYQKQLGSYKTQLASLTGQVSGLGTQLSDARSAAEREAGYRQQAENRLDAIARQNAYNQAMNPQAGGVKTKRSEAYEQGLTGRGSTGYFGREGLRITNLNL
jgi:hypothetical protein